jgi:hypothetical protein
MFQNILDYAGVLRLKAQLAKKMAAEAPRASASEIAALAKHQTEYWSQRHLDRSSLLHHFKALNDRFFNIAVFEVTTKKVSVWNKSPTKVAHRRKLRRAHIRTFTNRSALYRVFLEAVLAKHDIDADMVLAMDVSDISDESADFPLFSFQKNIGSRNILLPDVDFFHWNWYAGKNDPFGYDDKKLAAIFVGSSSGGKLTESKLAELALPRLRAAAYFAGNPRVDFRIANAVQCDTERTRSLLERQPYFSKRMNWSQQFSYRFLLSMDGNGAACSRLAMALKSNSALVKFDSPYLLYYFPAMVNGRDYVAVSSEQDVEEVINQELRSPGRFKPVAESGRSFFARFLNRESVVDYAGAILRSYARIYNG